MSVENLLESFIGNLFDSKENINYQIEFTLNLPYIYLVHINYFFTPEMKRVIRGNIHLWKCHSENCPSGKYSFGELFIRGTVLLRIARRGTARWEMSSGNCMPRKSPSGRSPSAKCPSGKCPDRFIQNEGNKNLKCQWCIQL